MSKKLDEIQSAIFEAERFIESAKQWQAEIIKQSGDKYFSYQSKQASNAKRKSMDLTRSLAVLRGRTKWPTQTERRYPHKSGKFWKN